MSQSASVITMKYVVVLLLLVSIPMARAEVSHSELKKLVEASRLDLEVLSMRRTIEEVNNRLARGMPTDKLARIFRGFAGKLDAQAIYNASVQELADSLEQSHLDALMPCFTSATKNKYHLAVYHRLTRQGFKAFRDKLVPLDLGVEQPDPERFEKLKVVRNQPQAMENQMKAMKQMLWLVNLDIKDKYPMLARSKEDMDQYFNQTNFEAMSNENNKYNLLVGYIMLENLNDEELAYFLECQQTPEMELYNAITAKGLHKYLKQAEASWVSSAPN